MRSRAPLLVAGIALAAMVALALAAAGFGTPSPSAAPGGSPPTSPVVGVLVGIDSQGLADVRGFRLRLVDGRVLAFTIGAVENPTEFPPGHLAEHLAGSQPVRVFFRVEEGTLVAVRLEDAG